MRGTFLSLLVLACAAFPLQAQLPLGFGLKGGARLTDFTASSSDVTPKDDVYTVGAYGELRLPAGFSIEADLLYKKSAAGYKSGGPLAWWYQQFNMDSLDVPILAKKTFAKELIFRPFVEAGLANRYRFSSATLCPPPRLVRRSRDSLGRSSAPRDPPSSIGRSSVPAPVPVRCPSPASQSDSSSRS